MPTYTGVICGNDPLTKMTHGSFLYVEKGSTPFQYVEKMAHGSFLLPCGITPFVIFYEEYGTRLFQYVEKWPMIHSFFLMSPLSTKNKDPIHFSS